MPQQPLRQSDTPAAPEINDPTTENIPQNEPSHSRGGKYNLHPNPNTNYSECTDIDVCKNLFKPFSCAILFL